MKFLFYLFLGAVGLPVACAQPTSHVDAYIQAAFTSSESIHQQQFLLQRNLAALKEAQALFWPSVNLGATYNIAGGGRTVDLPVGDLLNSVYRTLNQMTGADRFPQLENQRILLNPNNFYDVRLRTTYPLLNAELRYNQRIKQQQVDLQRTEINLYKRELARDIKIGYYRYLQATEALSIYQNARLLVVENQRVNVALFNNQKANRTSVVRSTNEVTRINAQLEVARQSLYTAQAYVNFLLNRPADALVRRDSITSVPDLAGEIDTVLTGREEMAKLRQAQAINGNLRGLAQAYKRPKVNAFVDIGSQGFDFAVNRRTPYYFGGISLDFNVFAGGRNEQKVRQVEYDGLALSANTRYVEGQLRLQLTTAFNGLRSALAQYQATRTQVTASQQYYNDMRRLYREGQTLYIELLDAQNQLINDQLQLNISRFDAWSKQAEVERATASFSLN